MHSENGSILPDFFYENLETILSWCFLCWRFCHQFDLFYQTWKNPHRLFLINLVIGYGILVSDNKVKVSNYCILHGNICELVLMD